MDLVHSAVDTTQVNIQEKNGGQYRPLIEYFLPYIHTTTTPTKSIQTHQTKHHDYVYSFYINANYIYGCVP